MWVAVDAPAARFAAGLPASLKRAFEIATDPLSGTILLIASAALTLITAGAAKMNGPSAIGRIARGSGFVFVCTLLALVCSTALKVAIGRARPDLLAVVGPHALSWGSTSHDWTSFPSGQTAMAAGFFGALSMLAWQAGRDSLAALALFPPLLVAVARPLIGEHYPSDTLAGLLLAAIVVIATTRLLGRHLVPSRATAAH